MDPNLPPAFVEQMQDLLGLAATSDFKDALLGEPITSVQLHPEKGRHLFADAKPVPWYEAGRYLEKRPVFTLDPAFQAGAYYVQEASSMFVAWLADKSLPNDRSWKILDLCAAPGGKSCLLATVAPPGSLLISNEVIRNRYGILKYNLAKWGMDNCWTTNLDPERFSGLEDFFDLVLVDAPCSGEGMFRKDPAAIDEWSVTHVDLCAARQDRILKAAAPLVAPGGLLLYSTCTYNQKENEAHTKLLREDFNFHPVEDAPPEDWGISVRPPGYQFYPHLVRGEGFFALAMQRSPDELEKRRYPRKKPGHWTLLKDEESILAKELLSQPGNYQYYRDGAGLIHALEEKWIPVAEMLIAALGRIDLGFPVGTIKGKQIVPAAELAFHEARSKNVNAYEVDQLTALQLLKKETPPLTDLPKGWVLITYQGNGLLWVKGLGNRYNNYYPSAWRIRMNLPK